MPKRDNINFRHTTRDFKAAKQTSVWSKINRNLPYRLIKGIIRSKIGRKEEGRE